MKNILLLDTAEGSLNMGDEIINVSIKKNWKELFDDNYIMKLATHTPMYSPLQSLIYKNKLSVFKDADYKFLCGTNALYTNMLRPLPTWNINLFDCGLARETICLGAGIGVNSKHINLYTRQLYKKVLSRKYIHSVRDEKTKEFLESMGFRAENTGCPTLWGLTPEFCRSIPASRGEKVIFTLTYYEKDEDNDRLMVDVLLGNYKEVFFWPQCIKDLDYLSSIHDMDRIKVLPPSVEAYDRALSDPDVDYVGNRLHGGIFAMQHRSRAIIISIDYRAERMNQNYSFVCIKREDIASKLENLIHSEWNTSISGIDLNKIEAWKGQFEL